MIKNPHKKNHWSDLAKQWGRLAPPLRPSDEDVEIFQRAIEPGSGFHLLLGVTPELSRLAMNMVAMDNSMAMIRALWNPSLPGQYAVQGDWLAMPFAKRSVHVAMGDGSLTLLSYPAQYITLFEGLARILRTGSKVVIRLFVNPGQAESCDDVCQAALAGTIKSFHAFKWRLSMAIAAQSPDYNLNVSQTHAAFNRLLPNRERLAAITGWSMQTIETIDLYQGSPARYSYPKLSQVRQILPLGFKEVGLQYGSYELAERCPILILEYNV